MVRRTRARSIRPAEALPPSVVVEISCREVLREMSNYLEHDLDSGLRDMMERHFSACRHCSAVADGTRNVILLCADRRVFTLPTGFGERLRGLLAARSQNRN